jgi:hypothetical protein
MRRKRGRRRQVVKGEKNMEINQKKYGANEIFRR